MKTKIIDKLTTLEKEKKYRDTFCDRIRKSFLRICFPRWRERHARAQISAAQNLLTLSKTPLAKRPASTSNK